MKEWDNANKKNCDGKLKDTGSKTEVMDLLGRTLMETASEFKG